MALNRFAVNEVSGQGRNEMEMDRISVDAYETLQSADRPDEHTYEDVVTRAQKKRANVSEQNNNEKAEFIRSVIMIAVTAVCILILSTLASSIVVVVYHHTTIAKMQEDASSRRLDLLEVNQDTLEQRLTEGLTNTSQQLDTLEQTQANTSRQLDTLEQKLMNRLTNTSQQWDALEQTLTEGLVNTKQQLGMLERTQVKASRQQNTLEQTMTEGSIKTSRRLNTLEQTLTEGLANTSQQLDALEKTLTDGLANTSQANTSINLETLTERHTTTKRQLDILAEKQKKMGTQVAFSVYQLRSTLGSNVTPTFVYNPINTGHYDTSSGRFTCPLAGLYFFSFSFEHNGLDSGEAKCHFRVNSVGRVHVAVRQGPYEAASGSVIRHLAVNDIVTLFCNGYQHVLIGANTAIFSGFLITPD